MEIIFWEVVVSSTLHREFRGILMLKTAKDQNGNVG
jgi:hypothetical protein